MPSFSSGESALGNGPARSQDFTLINQEAFAFSGSEEFVAFVVAASRGTGELFKHALRRYGLLGGPRQLETTLRATRLDDRLPYRIAKVAVRRKRAPDAQ